MKLCRWARPTLWILGLLLFVRVAGVRWSLVALLLLAAPIAGLVRSTLALRRGLSRTARFVAALADTSAQPPGMLFPTAAQHCAARDLDESGSYGAALASGAP